MTRAAALILPLLLTCLDLVDAAKFSVNGLSKRASVTGVGGQADLTNTGDLSYFANITLNEKPFTVQIDTGMSDILFVPLRAHLTSFQEGEMWRIYPNGPS